MFLRILALGLAIAFSGWCEERKAAPPAFDRYAFDKYIREDISPLIVETEKLEKVCDDRLNFHIQQYQKIFNNCQILVQYQLLSPWDCSSPDQKKENKINKIKYKCASIVQELDETLDYLYKRKEFLEAIHYGFKDKSKNWPMNYEVTFIKDYDESLQFHFRLHWSKYTALKELVDARCEDSESKISKNY